MEINVDGIYIGERSEKNQPVEETQFVKPRSKDESPHVGSMWLQKVRQVI